MNGVFLSLLLTAVVQANPSVEPEHVKNRLYVKILEPMAKLDAAGVALPPPVLRDGMSGEEQQKAILKLAGSEQYRKEILRDSVTAPYILKTHDIPTEETIFRSIDLWFVVRGNLEKLNPRQIAGESSGKSIEVGNMRIESRILGDDELKSRNQFSQAEPDLSHWFVFAKGRLLDRIGFEATDEAMSTRSADSLVIASRTSPEFHSPGPFANRWRTISTSGEPGPEQTYLGGLVYAKISRLKDVAGALLVEVHCTFAEPRGWFQGEPILRSKFSLMAQDQVRRLRRELKAKRATSP